MSGFRTLHSNELSFAIFLSHFLPFHFLTTINLKLLNIRTPAEAKAKPNSTHGMKHAIAALSVHNRKTQKRD